MATTRYLCGILNPLLKSSLSRYASKQPFDLRVFRFSLHIACFYVLFVELRSKNLFHCTKTYKYPTGLLCYRVQIPKTKTYAHSVPIRQLVYRIVSGYSNYTRQKRVTEYCHECTCSSSGSSFLIPRYNIRIRAATEH